MRTRFWGITVFAGLLATAAAASAASGNVTPRSYDEVRDAALAHPLTTWPDRGPVDLKDLIRAAYTGTGRAIERSTGLFQEQTDLRPAAPKVTHATGVCGEATWAIHNGPATGLLSAGTTMKALVRLSSAANDPVDSAPRAYSLAIKMFPAPSSGTPVASVNLVTADQFGINGISRKGFMALDPQHGPLLFANTIAGTGFAAEVVGRAFTRIDPKAGERPLYPFTTVTALGSPVPFARTPDRIQFIAHKVRAIDGAPDFRQELTSYNDGELVFDIVLPPQAMVPNGETIGQLTLGKLVVSDVCDLELSFFHHPTQP